MFTIVIADTNGQILKGSREMERETAQPCLFLWFPLEQWLPFNLLLKRLMVVAANDILGKFPMSPPPPRHPYPPQTASEILHLGGLRND